MNYNYYFFLLENYRKKMNPNSDVLGVQKAVYQNFSNESLRQRQRYRHEMAKKRRARMENQKLMNLKIKELKEKQKEISRRYGRRNNYGRCVIGENSSLKSKFKEKPKESSSITVLLPILKKKGGASRFESSFNEGLDYGQFSIPKTMLPPGNEDISAYEVVKAAQELCTKHNHQQYEEDTDFGQENGFRGEEIEKIDKENLKPKRIVLTPEDDGNDILTNEKPWPVKGKMDNHIVPHIVCLPSYRNGVDNGKHLRKQKTSSLPKLNYGPCYEKIIHYYPYRRGGEAGDRLASLAVLGKAKSPNTYELLIVDDGPRSEEIRVKQKCCSNPKPFDILIIREKLPKSPNTS